MNFNLIINILIITIGTIVIYVYGIITVIYKIFPYRELRRIKRYIFDVTKEEAISNNNSLHNHKYLDRISFIDAHSKKAEIVMLGDSLIFRAEWKDLFPSANIANHGIDGDTTTGVLDRIGLIDRNYSNKVFIMIGVNDLLKGENIDRVFGNYQKIVSELVKNKFKVHIQSILFVGIKRNHLNKKIANLNNMLENFSHTSELISYTDLNKSLSNDSKLCEEYSNDGLHLNGKGYKAWKDLINPYIV